MDFTLNPMITDRMFEDFQASKCAGQEAEVLVDKLLDFLTVISTHGSHTNPDESTTAVASACIACMNRNLPWCNINQLERMLGLFAVFKTWM